MKHFRLVALVIVRATTLAYPELLPELVRRLEARAFRAVLFLLEHESETDDALKDLADLEAHGIIIAAPPSMRLLERLRDRRMPTLLYNCPPELPLVDSVSCDHSACGQLLAQALLDGGHRRFALIAAPADSLVGVQRIEGALATLRRGRALCAEVERGDYTYESGVAALDALLARMKPRPSALIAANDAMALGALDRARELQIRLPRELSVVGIDGTQMAGLPPYRLTTVRQPLAVMADAAVELLEARIASPERPVEQRLFVGEFIRGMTTRFAPRPR